MDSDEAIELALPALVFEDAVSPAPRASTISVRGEDEVRGHVASSLVLSSSTEV